MVIIDELDGLEESTKNKLQEALENYIKEHFVRNLNLTRLDFIFFPNDFESEIIKFQIEQGMYERGITNNPMGTAFGKTMEVIKDGVIKDRIFLRKEILFNLFGGNDEMQILSLNIIHHELCHVHDNYNLANMVQFQKTLDLESDSIDSVLNVHAMNIFSEYIVPMMAVSTKDHNRILDEIFLIDLINYTQEELNIYIEKFQNGIITPLNLFHELQLKTSHLLKVLSTILGELDGIDKEIAVNKEQKMDVILSNYSINECWLSLKSSLRELYNTYPNWLHADEISHLKNCILQTWNTFGVYPDDERIRIIN